MSEELLLINPRRRRRRNARGQFVKGASRRRRRNPIVANPRRRRRRRNPIAAIANPRRRRYRRRNPIAIANPRRRRRHHVTAVSYRRRRRYNPRIALSPRGVLNALIPAGMGAAGAVALDLVMNYVPLPAQFQTPMWKNVARIVGAIGLGYAASFVVGKEKAKQVTLGALTVASYTVLRDLIAQNFPQIGLAGTESYDMSDLRMSGVGYINPAPMLQSGRGNGMGAYMRGSMPTPAPGVGAYMRDSLDTVNSMSGVQNDGM